MTKIYRLKYILNAERQSILLVEAFNLVIVWSLHVFVYACTWDCSLASWYISDYHKHAYTTLYTCACTQCSAMKLEGKKITCVDKWLMMDILMNCCLFCSINFIIHCRRWFFFTQLVFCHTDKSARYFLATAQPERRGNGRECFDYMKLQLQRQILWKLFFLVLFSFCIRRYYESPDVYVDFERCNVFLMSRKVSMTLKFILPNQ